MHPSMHRRSAAITIMMHFHAIYVSAGGVGDYFQAVFEAVRDGEGTPYLVIQRQFEDDDSDVLYVETHDLRYSGHFRLRHVDLSSSHIRVELDRPRHNVVEVTYVLSEKEFREAAHFIDIISGIAEPDPE